MTNSRTTTKIYLDKRHECAGGKFTIKIRVTRGRKSRYYSTGIQLSEPIFQKVVHSSRRTEQERQLYFTLTAYESKAQQCIDRIPFFTFEQFESMYISNRGATDCIEQAFEAYITQIKLTGSFGYAESYQTTISSIKRYKPSLRFVDITVSFLKGYEAYLRDRGNSINTVSLYMRNLRTVFNNAIKEGLIDTSLYPFRKDRYVIPSESTKKRALNKQEIKKLFGYKPESDKEQFAKDIWIFSYLCNGMNMIDILNLQKQDIHNGYLDFIREKTKRSKRNVERIRVHLKPEILEIIKIYSGADKDYIFPFLEGITNAEKRRNKVKLVTKLVNKYLGTIGEKLGLADKLTTYSARHSFATTLKRNGVNTEFISESLGHASLKTTNIYLDSFEDDTIRNITDILLPDL